MGRTRAKLIIDFLTGGIITQSEPVTVCSSPDDEKKLLLFLRRLVATLTLDTGLGQSDIECPIKEQSLISAAELLGSVIDGIVLHWTFSLADMLTWLVMCDATQLKRTPRPFHSLSIVLTQLSICINLPHRITESDFATRADRYLLSLVACGDPIQDMYHNERAKILVIPECVIQSLRDPEFDSYKFLTMGPPALFYDSIHMLREMEYVFAMSSVERPVWDFDRLVCVYAPPRYDDWLEARRRMQDVLRLNNIPRSWSGQRKYDALIKKFGDLASVPLVTFARRI